MDIAFTIYGIAFLLCTIQTFRYQRVGDYQRHGEWAFRWFSLAIASGLYRVYISPLFLRSIQVRSGVHTPQTQEDIDREEERVFFVLNLVAWVFFVPNLIIAELLIRRLRKRSKVLQ
jgi:hypothetical protein